MIDLAHLEEYRENNRIEAKRALGGLPLSIWETYSAFANALGGILLLGVEEWSDKSLHSVDLPDPERLVREFWTLVNDPKKASVNILTRENVRIEKADDNRIIVITVPRASRFDRPVYVDSDPDHGCYRRSGEGDHRCTAEECAAMRRDAALVTDDMRLLKKTALTALLPESVAAYRRRMASLRPGHAWESLEDEAFLEKIGAAARDKAGRLRPTAGGLLMLGRYEEIRRAFPRFSLRYRDRQGEIAAGAEAENLFDFCTLALPRLTAPPLAADTGVCRALREAVGNALVNADYGGRRSVEIRRERSGVTVTNPGEFRMDLEKALSGGSSEPRNGALLRMFTLVGIGGGAGGGIPGIFNVWRDRGWGEPAIRPDPGTGSVTLTLPLGAQRARGSFRKDAERTAVRKAARKQRILQYLTDHASAPAEELAAAAGIRTSGAERILQELREAGLVSVRETDGQRRYRLKA